jgi:hypothetical protein
MNRLTAYTAAFIAMAGCSSADHLSPDGKIVFEEELRLDGNAEDFSVVGQVAVGPSGEIIVVMPMDAEFRIYDSTGKLQERAGRKGDAPGEFRYIGSVGYKGDTLWAMDAEAPRRFSLFTGGGQLIRVDPPLPGKLAQVPSYVPSAGYRFMIPMGLHPDGSMLATGRRRSPARATGALKSFISRPWVMSN